RPLDVVAEERRERRVGDRNDHEADEDDEGGSAETHAHGPLDYRRYRIENSRIQTTSTKCQYSETASTASWWRAENWPAEPGYRIPPTITTPPKTCAPWKPVNVKYVVPNGPEPRVMPSPKSRLSWYA